ncbi:MAG: tyrosine-protein phosphatase [Deltaproteobacteria bacterium]|nr:tyrosine-protein phosphatase [Deltaproteobacteria bacterium]
MPDALHLRSLPNFRDIGGVPTRDGQRLTKGRVFRSERPHRIASADRVHLETLGVGLVIDLRTAADRTRNPAASIGRAHVRSIPLHEDPAFDIGLGHLARFLASEEGEARFRAFVAHYYRHLAHERAPQIGVAISAIARASEPVWIHCTAGRDRTGMLVAIAQSALGVPEDVVLAGFRETDLRYAVRLDRLRRVLRAITLLRVPDARIRAVLRCQSETLAEVLTELSSRHGSIEGYVREACGVDDATFAALRSSLIR